MLNISSIDTQKESFSSYTIKIAKTIFEANIKSLLSEKIKVNELKEIALKHIPPLNTIRDGISIVGISQEQMLDSLFRLDENFVSILNEIATKKSISHTNIGNYIGLLTSNTELKKDILYVSNTPVIRGNTLLKKKYLFLFLSLILIGFWIFDNRSELNTPKRMESMAIESKGEVLYLKIENLLAISENLLTEYLRKPSINTNQIQITVEKLAQRLEEKKDAILIRSEKYIKIKDNYQNMIDAYHQFLKSCQEKSLSFSRIQKIDISLKNLRFSIETLKDIYDSEMLNLKVLQKQQKDMHQLSRQSIEQAIILVNLKNLMNDMKGERK